MERTGPRPREERVARISKLWEQPTRTRSSKGAAPPPASRGSEKRETRARRREVEAVRAKAARRGSPRPAPRSRNQRARQMVIVPLVAWSFELPSGIAMRPSTTIGLFQCPLPQSSVASTAPVAGSYTAGARRVVHVQQSRPRSPDSCRRSHSSTSARASRSRTVKPPCRPCRRGTSTSRRRCATPRVTRTTSRHSACARSAFPRPCAAAMRGTSSSRATGCRHPCRSAPPIHRATPDTSSPDRGRSCRADRCSSACTCRGCVTRRAKLDHAVAPMVGRPSGRCRWRRTGCRSWYPPRRPCAPDRAPALTARLGAINPGLIAAERVPHAEQCPFAPSRIATCPWYGAASPM